MKNAAALQKALEGKPRAEPVKLVPVAEARAGKTQDNRVGKDNVSAWLSPDYNRSLQLIRLEHPKRTKQALIAEALNLLFERYNVPVVRGE